MEATGAIQVEDGETIITLEFITNMVRDFEKEIPLQERYVYQILENTKELFLQLPSLVDITVPDHKHITICGDIHGQFYDLVNIFDLNGKPSEDNPYLFNGDFVDHGAFSLEVILTLFAYKCLYPNSIYLVRGNHETKSMNYTWGFKTEVESKLSIAFVELFDQVFCCLPLAHVINSKVFVVHGGLSSEDGVKLSDIRAIDRFREPPEEGLMCDLLWSDPGVELGRCPSLRGKGIIFGPDVTKKFLEDNGLALIVRSHEMKTQGYEFEHDGNVLTIFSAPKYRDREKNKGAIIRFEAPRLEPDIIQFSHVPHPEVMFELFRNMFIGEFLSSPF